MHDLARIGRMCVVTYELEKSSGELVKAYIKVINFHLPVSSLRFVFEPSYVEIRDAIYPDNICLPHP
jgi:hypothetical protein